MGSGCGSVGRAVASDVRGPRFISSHRRNLNWTLFTVNWIEKTKIKKKEVGNGPFLKKHFLYSLDSVAPWQSSGTPLHRRRTSHPWHPVLGWISGLQRQLQKILCKSCLGYFCKKIWPKKFRKLTKSHRLLSLALVTQQEHKFSGANTINKFQHIVVALLWNKPLWLMLQVTWLFQPNLCSITTLGSNLLMTSVVGFGYLQQIPMFGDVA